MGTINHYTTMMKRKNTLRWSTKREKQIGAWPRLITLLEIILYPKKLKQFNVRNQISNLTIDKTISFQPGMDTVSCVNLQIIIQIYLGQCKIRRAKFIFSKYLDVKTQLYKPVLLLKK